MNKEPLLKELKYCINFWKEKGGCKFGGETKCENCASPYLLLKLISGEILEEKITLKNWENKLNQL
jgi:hypothetical protein